MFQVQFNFPMRGMKKFNFSAFFFTKKMNFPNKLERKRTLTLTGLLILHNKLHMQKIVSQGSVCKPVYESKDCKHRMPKSVTRWSFKSNYTTDFKAVEKFLQR